MEMANGTLETGPWKSQMEVGFPNSRIIGESLKQEVGGWRMEGGCWIYGDKFECDPKRFSHQKVS